MSIPGLGTLKTWGLILLSIGAAIAFALFKNEQAGRAREKLKGEVQARKTAKAVSKAMMGGMSREQAELNEAHKSDRSKRTGFE